MTARVCMLAVALVAAAPPPAAAQTPTTPVRPKRASEFLIGGLFAGPTPLGTTKVDLLNSSGTPSGTLFRAKNRATGFGLELNIGLQLRGATWMEVSGGWTRATVTSLIDSDFENADSEPIKSPMSRFLLEGALVRYLRERGNNAWFVRVNAGWMREAAGGATLTGDGLTGGGGVGFRHWWQNSGKVSTKRVGLRLEGRAVIRSGGISLGENGVRVGPAAVAHLVIGY